MALIVDAGALFVQANRVDQDHGAITNCLAVEPTPIVTSELALAEADYLILTRLGIEAELIFLDDLAAGILRIDCLSRDELGIARDLARRYRDLRLGLADCSLIILAQRYQKRRIATLNQRHFRAVTPLQGGAFTVLPADA